MITVTLKEGEGKEEAVKNTICLYNSIEEIPIEKYVALQKYLLLDACVGSTFQDVMKHFEKLDFFLEHSKIEEAKKERVNLHTGMFLQVEKMNTKSMAFACLIHSIDGEDKHDLSESGLEQVCRDLEKTAITAGDINKHLSEVKKKLIGN